LPHPAPRCSVTATRPQDASTAPDAQRSARKRNERAGGQHSFGHSGPPTTGRRAIHRGPSPRAPACWPELATWPARCLARMLILQPRGGRAASRAQHQGRRADRRSSHQ